MISVILTPKWSSMTTTSPRAMSLPLMLNSTGASAGLSSCTTEPTASWSTSRIGSWQPPSSMVRLTGTSRTRLILVGFSAVAFMKYQVDRRHLLNGEFGEIDFFNGAVTEDVVESGNQLVADEILRGGLFQIGDGFGAKGALGHIAELCVVRFHLIFEIGTGADDGKADEQVTRTHGAGDVDEK